MAKLADGAVVVTYGETQVLATCVSSNPREGIDFFPLTIDVEERMYAVGKIPGSFFRREGRPSETAVLTCRLIDRPLRPTFRDGYRDEVQVVITVLGMDGENPYDIPAMNAASVATCLAGLPFDGPVASVRMGLIDGQWVVNPTFQQVEEATFDVVVAGRKNDAGEIDVLMIEGEAPDNTWDLLAGGAPAPTEETVAEGLEAAKRAIAEQIDFQREFLDEVDVTEKDWTPRPLYGDDLYEMVSTFAADRLGEAIVPDKAEREAKLDALKAEAKEHVAAQLGDESSARMSEFGAAWKQVQKKVMRARVIKEGIRLDGRTPTEIRPLSAEVGVLKRAHGSALFSRGDTQVLNITTLGMLRMTQMIDTLDLSDSKRYMHHYNFPPFSTGETGRVGSPRRREIGHGALAERALIPVVPHEDEFPYALRLVSDVLSSNGSTSMASVCGSTLSLMDAGVPIKAPVAGIAMGMIADDGAFVTLTDILGAEDALGDMDFKVAGTREFVTAIQLDMKVTGLPGVGARRRAAAGARRALPDPRRDGSRDRGAARGGQRQGAAHHLDPDPRGQDRRGDRAQGQAHQRDHRAHRGRHRHPGRRHGVDRLHARRRGRRRGGAHDRRDREPATGARGRAVRRHRGEDHHVRRVREPRAGPRRPGAHLEARQGQAPQQRRGGREGRRHAHGARRGHRHAGQDQPEAGRRGVGDPRGPGRRVGRS